MIKHKTAKILSFLVIGSVAVLGWLAYKNRERLPFSEGTAPVQTVSESDKQTDNSTNHIDLTPAKVNEVVKYVRITNKTYIRRKPENNSTIISVLNKGFETKYLSQKGSFYLVRYDDCNDGWVLKSDAEILEEEVEITYAPKHTIDTAYSLNDAKEGDDLGAILRKYRTVGASVAVIKDGHVTYHYEFGYADKENRITVNENTKFRVASLSKVFTAMLAMAEVNDGQLDLDANISEIFGYKFCNPKYPNTAISTRMLLTHSAGFTDKQGFSEPLYAVAIGENYYSYKPGNKHLYSNLSIGIAGAVVEKASDRTLSQYARDRFFAPMGIDASFYSNYLSDDSLIANCYLSGSLKYSRESIIQSKESTNAAPGYVYYVGQSGLLISAVDLAKVTTILLNEGQYNGVSYLSADTVNQMLTVHPVDTQNKYQQCIGVRKYNNLIGERDIYYHTGNYYGIYALLAFDPDDKSGVIIITSGANTIRDDNTIFGVCNDVMDYCYSELL